jgi:hypothetical protein
MLTQGDRQSCVDLLLQTGMVEIVIFTCMYELEHYHGTITSPV